ncbi:MAG: hypothetical protein PHQ40_21455 [Anaerolineaceae bacterium]|nr:hypothetical protein [Anaerolineaceae bacterium]
MDTLLSLFSPIANLLAILAFTVGLWMAGRLLPRVLAWIRVRELRDQLSQMPARVLLWIALGALLSSPLIDGVSWLANLVNVLLAPSTGGEFSTALGSVSIRVYASFPLFLAFGVYWVTLWLGQEFLGLPGRFTRTERTFLILTVASLVYRGIHGIFPQVFTFQLPTAIVQQNCGVAGFLVETAIGFALLAAIMVGLNRALPSHPLSGK